jgi:adenylate kinase
MNDRSRLGFLDEFDFSKRPKEDIVENLKQILKLRDRKNPPLRFPRVILIRPPKLKERAQFLVETFSKRYPSPASSRYGLQAFNTFHSLEEQIHSKTELGKYIQKCLTERIPIPNDIVSSLIYTKVMVSFQTSRFRAPRLVVRDGSWRAFRRTTFS